MFSPSLPCTTSLLPQYSHLAIASIALVANASYTIELRSQSNMRIAADKARTQLEVARGEVLRSVKKNLKDAPQVKFFASFLLD